MPEPWCGADDNAGRVLADAWFSPSWVTELPLRLLDAFRGAVPADGAALLLAADTSQLCLQPACATEGRPMVIENLQQVLGEGPASRCFHDGQPVLVPDLGARDDRWPALSSALGPDRHEALYAFPLQWGKLRIAVLDLYRIKPSRICAYDAIRAVRAGQELAQQLLELTAPPDEMHPVGPWFDQRGEIAALGAASELVSRQLGLSLGDAHALLRGHTFAAGRALSAVVADVLSGTLFLER